MVFSAQSLYRQLVYDQQLLKKIREGAHGYMHGHEVGGTNPSLLEGLASTKINLLLNVGFNTEVGGNGALYWEKRSGDLAKLLDQADVLGGDEISRLDQLSTSRIKDAYRWEDIITKYEEVFLEQ